MGVRTARLNIYIEYKESEERARLQAGEVGKYKTHSDQLVPFIDHPAPSRSSSPRISCA